MYKNKNTNDSSYFLDNIIYSGSKISEIKPKDSISEDVSTNTPPSSPDFYYDYYCNPALTKAIDKLSNNKPNIIINKLINKLNTNNITTLKTNNKLLNNRFR